MLATRLQDANGTISGVRADECFGTSKHILKLLSKRIIEFGMLILKEAQTREFGVLLHALW